MNNPIHIFQGFILVYLNGADNAMT